MHALRPGFLAFAANALLASAVSAQIFIVDASNGPGTNFTSLTAAVAAVPDGAVLRVMSGSYAAPTIQAKGLSIVGEPGASVTITAAGPSIQVLQTSAHQPVLLKNLIFGDTLFTYAGELLFRDAAASISCVDLRISTGSVMFIPAATTFRVERCANVLFEGCDFSSTEGVGTAARIYAEDSQIALHQCDVRGLSGEATTLGASDPGSTAVHLVRTRCWSSGSVVRGGIGGIGCVHFPGCNSTSGDGGTGVYADDHSTFLSLRTAVHGGDGRDGFTQPPSGHVPPSNGGTGIVVWTNSGAHFEGAQPLGGLSQAINGSGAIVHPSGGLIIELTAEPSVAEISGTQSVGSIVHLVLTAPPSTLGALYVATTADLFPIDFLNPGSLLLFAFPATGSFAVGASGAFDFAFAIPASYPLGQTFFTQFLTVHPTTLDVYATNPMHVHVNH